MSALFSYQTNDAVIILTDGAIYDVDNRIVKIKRKIQISARAPLAVGTRGHVGLGDFAAERIIEVIEAEGFDFGMLSVPDIVAQIDSFERLHAVDIVIAGVSETLGPRHMHIKTGTGGMLSFEPLTLTHPGRTFVGVPGIEDGLDPMGIRRPYLDEDPEDYFRDVGPDLLEYGRSHPEVSPVDGKISMGIIGGLMDLTVVSREGVRVETIYKWPDKIGQRIDPLARGSRAGDRMNRQQRRQAERQKRKLAA